MPALASKMDEFVSPLKSWDTTSSSVYASTPFILPSAASLMVFLITSYDAAFSSPHVRSTTDTSATGTRNAMPVSLPFMAGITLPTALAAPVEDGMMFWYAPRPPRQSLELGPSTVFCVAVTAWTVVIRPSTMPKLSLITLTSGARQLVVHDALLTTFWSFEYFSLLTPMTNMGASAEGAEMITLEAPPDSMCTLALSTVVKTPVDSTT